MVLRARSEQAVSQSGTPNRGGSTSSLHVDLPGERDYTLALRT